MTNDVAELLAELRQDHRNMAILVELLRAGADRIDNDEQPDFELLHDIMRYMTTYADVVHHPKEDLVYAAMRSARPELSDGLERVAQDHEEIAALGEQLRDDIEAVIAGTEVTRERVVSDTRHYLRRLQQHMTWEEEDLFRHADAMADTCAIDTVHLAASDPVFGTEREVAFANLLRAIHREALEIPR